MEKKKKLDVSNIDLVSFEGFYQTIWDSSFEVSDYEYRNEVVEDEDFTFSEDSYQKAVCEASSGNAGSSSMFAKILNYPS